MHNQIVHPASPRFQGLFLSNLHMNLYRRDEAISTADESLTHDTPNQPSIRRRLKKSYGVNSRVEFNENEHDSAHKVKDYDGSLWCNNIIRWMAYKVSIVLLSILSINLG